MSIDVAGRLKDMDDAWDGTDPVALSGAIVDGDYQASVARFDFTESLMNNALQLMTEFQIVAPDYIGRTVRVWHDLENPERLKWTKMHLELLGVEDGPLSTLEQRLAKVLDVVCEISLKSKKSGDKTYQNVYLNRVMHDVKVERDEDEPREGTPIDDNPPPHADDDIPF